MKLTLQVLRHSLWTRDSWHENLWKVTFCACHPLQALS